MTIARMKLAIGPATTTAARVPTVWCTKLTRRSASDISAMAA